MNGFVDRIVPFEPAGGTRPGHDHGGPVRTLRQSLRARLRRALYDPLRADRVVEQLDIGWSGENHGFGQGWPLSHAAQPLNRSSPNKT